MIVGVLTVLGSCMRGKELRWGEDEARIVKAPSNAPVDTEGLWGEVKELRTRSNSVDSFDVEEYCSTG